MRRYLAVIAASGLGALSFVSSPSEAQVWSGSGWGGWHPGFRVSVGPSGRNPGPRPGWYGSGWWPYGVTTFGARTAAVYPYWRWAWDSPADYYGTGHYTGEPYPTRTFAPAYRTAPVATGRSVAAGSLGLRCATEVKTCVLRNASYVGGGCSCKVTGGRAQGAVVP
jgi:hypothetical protein